MVGDTWKDMDAGRAAGCKTILVRHAEYPEDKKIQADKIVGSVSEAADLILKGL